jgi:2-oxoisovalerate dehydrogenase E1 component
VAYEDSISWGYGAEIAARIADECFAWLDAPVKRIASKDVWVGYAPQLEDAILPQTGDFLSAYLEIVKY